ncbi:hypothetical protein CICLE_v10017498mg [Citrus x clementina]|uniref:Leucine-rich repeat-containing N-terminal plant-type domain-containing protein n=1 Tax=Citrus clementina TaxID=85681 RepID=V4TLK4_CITCL|nr:hypothetical protein CICLE_v10017498mg [Citrus x clementina]
MRAIYLCVSLVFVLSISVSVQTQSRPDAAVMQDLKASLVIPKHLKWSDPDACQWSHVICSDNGQLTNIELQDQNLKGTLPPSLEKLSSLAVMHLENNQLMGPIPSLVGLRYLQVVIFDNDSFSYMPPDALFSDICSLSSLEDLSLGHNKLTGIFPVSSFDNHPKLTTLNLTNNLLQGPTPRFNNSKLTVDIRTGSNSFCLDDLGLACDSRVNILFSIAESMGAESWKGNDPCPTCLGEIRNITGISFQILGLSGNISSNFSMLTSLKYLIVSNNSLPGTIPSELTTPSSLQTLDVSNNHLHGRVP